MNAEEYLGMVLSKPGNEESKMKRLVLGMLALLAFPTMALADGVDKDACTYKGIPLYGKVEIVEHFGDIKIEIVDHFGDIKVQKVDHFPDSCGKWEIVDHFGDFKVEFVEHFGDIKVEFVDHFPGTK